MTCLDNAMLLLSIREHTVVELREKLLKKGYSAEDISSALETVREKGYQSDARFCEVYIRSRLRRNPEGRSPLIMRLAQKGVDKAVAREAVDRYFEENEDEINEIFAAYAEKLVKSKGEQRALTTLYRKGIRLTDSNF